MDVYYRPAVDSKSSSSESDNWDAKRGSDQTSIVPPVVTCWMLVSIIAVFLAMVLVGHGQASSVAHLFGAKEPALIRSGQWWRLITPIFLHGNWIHLIFNGVSLFWFGGQMEQIYGARKYFLIFIAAGISGNVLSCLMLPGPSLGASGALFGLIGAGIVFPLRFGNLLPARERNMILRQLIIVAVINLGLSFMAGIDRYAHFGGFLGGALFALFLVPDVLDDRPRNVIRERFLSLATILTLLVVVTAAAEQWNVARAEVESTVITYTSGGRNPWWRFQLSSLWRPAPRAPRNGSFWLGPQGASINVVDSTADTELFAHSEQWRAERGAVAIPLNVDGRTATLSTVTTNGTITQLCQILMAGRALDISLVCSAGAYPTVERDYAALLDSVRFGSQVVPVPLVPVPPRR